MPSASTYGSIGEPGAVVDPRRTEVHRGPTDIDGVGASADPLTSFEDDHVHTAQLQRGAAVRPEMPAPTTTTRPTGPSTGSGTEPVRSSACTSGVEARSPLFVVLSLIWPLAAPPQMQPSP